MTKTRKKICEGSDHSTVECKNGWIFNYSCHVCDKYLKSFGTERKENGKSYYRPVRHYRLIQEGA